MYSINTAQIAALTGVPLAGSYLQLVGDQPGGLGEIPLPHLDAGPFLSYGIQWIAFGDRRTDRGGLLRPRRGAATPTREGRNPVLAAASTAPLTTDEKLADRYGRRR